jgi:hypothetical protein
MLRLILTAGVAFALLMAATAWFAERPRPERLSETLGPLLEQGLDLAERARDRIDDVAPAGTPAATEPAPSETPPLLPSPKPASAPAVVAGEIPEATLDTLASAPFREGPMTAPPPEGHVEAEVVRVAAADPDQERWASLIRRMLSIYARVSPEP